MATNWYPLEPNGTPGDADCVIHDGTRGFEWYDRPCNELNRVLCETS